MKVKADGLFNLTNSGSRQIKEIGWGATESLINAREKAKEYIRSRSPLQSQQQGFSRGNRRSQVFNSPRIEVSRRGNSAERAWTAKDSPITKRSNSPIRQSEGRPA